jgi:hypothetical protein
MEGRPILIAHIASGREINYERKLGMVKEICSKQGDRKGVHATYERNVGTLQEEFQ